VVSYEEDWYGAPVDPIALVTRLARADPYPDYVVYERDGRWTFAGGVLAAVSLEADRVRTRFVDGSGIVQPWSGSPASALRRALDAVPVQGWNAYGWIGFDFAGVIPALGPTGAAAPPGELAQLPVPRIEVSTDGTGVLIRGADAAEREWIRTLIARPDGPGEPAATPVDVRAADASYRERVAQAVKEIRQGQYQKVILSRTVPIPFPADLVGTYAKGRRANTPARSFLLRFGGLHAAGFSPEVIVTVDADGQVLTQPLAGTRAFGRGPALDAAARDELESNPKEVFEHAVSVRTAQDEEVVERSLRLTGVHDLAGRLVDELSGGQRRRVWLAMALAQQTSILLLDEPTTFLDIAHQYEVLDLCAELHAREGRTLVAVLHDLNQACRYATHLIALRPGGQIAAQGDPAKVITAGLVEDVFGLPCRVIEDPETGTPLVVPLRRGAREQSADAEHIPSRTSASASASASAGSG